MSGGFSNSVYSGASQIEKLEHRRKQVLEGTVCVQKHFRGYHARCCLYELKGAKKSKSCNDTHLVKELQPDGLKSIKKPGRKFSEGKVFLINKEIHFQYHTDVLSLVINYVVSIL